MDQHSCEDRNAHASNIKARHNLERVSKYWDKCRDQQVHMYDRDHQQLERHLLELTKEYEHSRAELLELKSYLAALEEAEELEHQGSAADLEELAYRRAMIIKYRQGIHKLLKHSQKAAMTKHDMTQRAPPSAHYVAMRMLHSGNVKRRRRPRVPDSTEITDTSAQKPDQGSDDHKQQLSHRVKGPKSGQDGRGPPSRPPTPSPPRAGFRLPSLVNVDGRGTDDDSTNWRAPAEPTLDGASAAGSENTPGGAKLMTASMPAFPAHDSAGVKCLASRRTQSIGTRRGINIPVKSKTSSDKKPEVDLAALEKYCLLLSLDDGADHQGAHPSVGHFSEDRLKHRRMVALESVLHHLPSYHRRIQFVDPRVALNCRYLRLTANNVADLEAQCRRQGYEPGLHAHMDVDDVLEYFKQHPKVKDSTM